MAPHVLGLHPAEKVEDYVARGWWSREVVDEVFLANVRAHPDRLALIDPANKAALVGAEPRRLTWREIESEVEHLAAAFLDLGLRRGDVIGVQLPNTVELVEVYLAGWMIGVVVSPLAMQYREHEVTGMAGQAGFVAFLGASRFGDRAPLEEAVAARERMPSIRHYIRYAASDEVAATPPGVVVVTAAEASDDDRAAVTAYRQLGRNDPNDAMTICWTSGTEAEPKGVPRTHLEWLAGSWAGVDAPEIVESDVLLNPFPMVNMAAFVGLLLPWLRSGCVLVQHHPFDLPVFLGQIAAEKVTYTVAPPALLMMLLHNEALMAQVDLSSLTRLGSGSAPLQPPMVEGWQDRYGIGVINFFGSNEGVALLSCPADFPDPVTRARFFPNYSCAGYQWASRVSAWVQLRLVDLASEREITEPGVVGELRIAGPTVFPGYLGGESRESPFDEQGHLRTGDLFEIAGDQGQYLLYVDRARDLVIRGGMNIAPAEIEGLIAAHPAVTEVAVVGDPDATLGERVAAVVVLNPEAELDLDALVDFLRGQQIASFKLPERLQVVPALPRNPVGKVLKRELRRTAEEVDVTR